MNCPECDRLAREYDMLIKEHSTFVDQYYAAVRASEVDKMWELRFAASGARMLAIRARNKLTSHQATHAGPQKAVSAS
jgi:hypothetical protein